MNKEITLEAYKIKSTIPISPLLLRDWGYAVTNEECLRYIRDEYNPWARENGRPEMDEAQAYGDETERDPVDLGSYITREFAKSLEKKHLKRFFEGNGDR